MWLPSTLFPCFRPGFLLHDNIVSMISHGSSCTYFHSNIYLWMLVFALGFIVFLATFCTKSLSQDVCMCACCSVYVHVGSVHVVVYMFMWADYSACNSLNKMLQVPEWQQWVVGHETMPQVPEWWQAGSWS